MPKATPAAVLGCLMLVLVCNCALAEERLQSGLQPGEELSAIFEPLNVTGEHAGELHCLVCENGANPVAMIFARELSEPLVRLIARLDAATARHRDQDLGSFIVFLSDREDLPKQLEEVGQKQKLKHLVLSTFDPAGPEGFKVTKDADVTVVLYENHKVKANHAFKRGGLTSEAIDKILADLPKILPAKKSGAK